MSNITIYFINITFGISIYIYVSKVVPVFHPNQCYVYVRVRVILESIDVFVLGYYEVTTLGSNNSEVIGSALIFAEGLKVGTYKGTVLNYSFGSSGSYNRGNLEV